MLEACCSQLAAAAGGGPFGATREALLCACGTALLGVLRCDSYAGKSGGSGGEERVSGGHCCPPVCAAGVGVGDACL
jgi:hypothetical protein